MKLEANLDGSRFGSYRSLSEMLRVIAWYSRLMIVIMAGRVGSNLE